MFVVIGSTTVDIVVTGEDEVMLPQQADGFRADNLIFTATPLTLMMGGNGGNSAYVLAGLGVDVTLCGAVGQDAMGDLLVDWARAAAIFSPRPTISNGMCRRAICSRSMTPRQRLAVIHCSLIDC